jgi:hypothetical protein
LFCAAAHPLICSIDCLKIATIAWNNGKRFSALDFQHLKYCKQG